MGKLVCLVTGASSGLGREIARLLCQQGHIVYVVARRKDKLLELKTECSSEKGEINVVAGDLTDPGFRQKLVNKIIKFSKRIDCLVNNAGFGTAIEFTKQPLEDIIKMFNLNVIAMEHLTSLVLQHMKQSNNGRIINISSIVAFTPLPYFATYNATKSAVFNFTRSLRYELRDTNIFASVVLPTRMKTHFGNVAFSCYRSDKKHYDKCVHEWNKIAGSPSRVAWHIVNKLNSRHFLILPGFKSKLFYLLGHLPLFSLLIDFVSSTSVRRMLKKSVSGRKIVKDYYKKC